MPPAYKQVSDAELDQAAAAYRQVSDEELDRAAAGVGPTPASTAPTFWSRMAAARRGVNEFVTPQGPGLMRSALDIFTPSPTSPVEAATLPLMFMGPAGAAVGRVLPAAGRGIAALVRTAPRRIAAQTAAAAGGGTFTNEGVLAGAAQGALGGVLGEGVGAAASGFMRYGPGGARRMAEKAIERIGRTAGEVAPTLPKFRTSKEMMQATDVGVGGATATEALGRGWQTGMGAVERGLGGTRISVPTLADPDVQAFLRNPRKVAGMQAEGVIVPESGEVSLRELNDAIKLIGSSPVFKQAPESDIVRKVQALYGQLVNEARAGIKTAEQQAAAQAVARVTPQSQPANRGLALPPAPAERTFQAGAPAPPAPPRQPLALPEVTGAPPGDVIERGMHLPAVRPGGPPGRPRKLTEARRGAVEQPAEMPAAPHGGERPWEAMGEPFPTAGVVPPTPGTPLNPQAVPLRQPTGPAQVEVVGRPEQQVRLRARQPADRPFVEDPTGVAPVVDVTAPGGPPTREYIGPEVQLRGEPPAGPAMTEYPLTDLWDRTRQEFKMGKNVQGLLESAYNPATAHTPTGYQPSIEALQERLASVKPQKEIRRYIGEEPLEQMGEAATFGLGLGGKDKSIGEMFTPWEDRILGTGLLGLIAGGAGFAPGYGVSAATLGSVAGRRFLAPNLYTRYAHAPGQLPYTVAPGVGSGVDWGLLSLIENMRSQQREEEPLP